MEQNALRGGSESPAASLPDPVPKGLAQPSSCTTTHLRSGIHLTAHTTCSWLPGEGAHPAAAPSHPQRAGMVAHPTCGPRGPLLPP